MGLKQLFLRIIVENTKNIIWYSLKILFVLYKHFFFIKVLSKLFYDFNQSLNTCHVKSVK